MGFPEDTMKNFKSDDSTWPYFLTGLVSLMLFLGLIIGCYALKATLTGAARSDHSEEIKHFRD